MFELREFNPAYGQMENKLIDEESARALLAENCRDASTVDWVIEQLKANAFGQVTCGNKGVMRYVHE